jgi:hypothetical protein
VDVRVKITDCWKTRGLRAARHGFFSNLTSHHITNEETGMLRNLVKSKSRLLGVAVILAASFAAGCGTAIPEKSGTMPNQNTSKHVKGYQMGNSDAVRPVMPLPVLW